MAVGSGIGGYVGAGIESTYGTYAAPTQFLRAISAPLKEDRTRVHRVGLTGGAFLPDSDGYLDTTRQVSGDVDVYLMDVGMGALIQTLMGTTVTPVQQAATTAYLQTHTMADPAGKSVTLQSVIPQLDGTARVFSFLGCKVASADFSFPLAAEATAKFTVDGQQLDETQTAATASFPTGRQYVGTDVNVKVGAIGSEASVDGVRKVDVTIGRPMRTDRFYLGAAGVKKEPILNARDLSVTGTIDSDFIDKTIWQDRFTGNTGFSLVVEAVGSLIASTYYHTFRITLPNCHLTGATPELNGPDVVTGSFPFVCLRDSATGDLPKIEIISTETTVA